MGMSPRSFMKNNSNVTILAGLFIVASMFSLLVQTVTHSNHLPGSENLDQEYRLVMEMTAPQRTYEGVVVDKFMVPDECPSGVWKTPVNEEEALRVDEQGKVCLDSPYYFELEDDIIFQVDAEDINNFAVGDYYSYSDDFQQYKDLNVRTEIIQSVLQSVEATPLQQSSLFINLFAPLLSALSTTAYKL